MTDVFQRVPMDEIDEDDDGVANFNGIVFTGIAYENEGECRPASEITFRDGLMDGAARDFYSNSQLKSESQYQKGGRHGFAREWAPSGELLAEALFEFGILVEEKKWDVSGRLISSWQIEPKDPLFDTLMLLRKKRET